MAEPQRAVDTLVLHGLIVPMDERLSVLDDGGLAVRGTDIVAVGASAEIQSQFAAPQVLDASGQLVLPGLINVHTHAAAIIFRGLCEDMRLEPWLQKAWHFESKFVNADSMRLGARLAHAEMIQSGTTCALDMYWFPEVSAEVAHETGFRLMTGPPYISIPNIPDGITENERTARGREFLQHYKNDPLIISCVQPHSTYTVSPQLLTEARELAAEFGVFLNTHCSESVAEVQIVKEKEGMTPPRLLDHLGMLSDHTVLAHCVQVPGDEIDLFAARKVTVAHCPISNMKLAAGISPIAKMKRAGVKVALGTDGAQSSNDLNLWNPMRIAPILQKTVENDPTVLPAPDIVKMATCDAANALGLGERIGSLEAGKRADLILINLDNLHALPLYDIYAQIVYALGRDDVNTVMINGRLVMRDRELLTINEPDLKGQMRELAAQIDAELIKGS